MGLEFQQSDILAPQSDAYMTHKKTHLPSRPDPGPVFCSPAPLLDILSVYRTCPVQNKQVRDSGYGGKKPKFN